MYQLKSQDCASAHSKRRARGEWTVIYSGEVYVNNWLIYVGVFGATKLDEGVSGEVKKGQ